MASSSLLQIQKQLWKKSRSFLVVSRRIAGFSSSSVRTRTDDEVRALFEEWTIKHGQRYEDPKEKELRFQYYRARLRQFDLHNNNRDPSFTPMLDSSAANHFTGGLGFIWQDDEEENNHVHQDP